ncbi:MAG TPA: hypothetical protein VHY91_15005 [Pirellulales bacterium]|nr:hypothetical protein [Pirellulales bacterium]
MRQAILFAVLCMALESVAAAQPPSGQEQGIAPLTPQKHYNGIVAGEEAYLANDARRQAEIGRQYNLIGNMYWRWSGVSSWYPGVFEAWPLVPGEIVGWPAASSISPPRLSSTNVRYSPLAQWGVVPSSAAGAKPAPAIVAPRSQQTTGATAADTNPSPGLLPGFVPQADSTDGSQPKSGPRAF